MPPHGCTWPDLTHRTSPDESMRGEVDLVDGGTGFHSIQQVKFQPLR